METLSWLFGVIAWLGYVIILFRMFKMKGLLHGILGLIFPIYPFSGESNTGMIRSTGSRRE